MSQKLKEDMCTKSFLIHITAFLVFPPQLSYLLKSLHLLTVHINKRLLNICVLPSQCEYADSYKKILSTTKCICFWTPHGSSIACYRANKNKCYIPYSEVMFSYFIIQLQYNVYEISVKKLYNLFFFIHMNYKNNCLCTHLKCSVVCIIV